MEDLQKELDELKKRIEELERRPMVIQFPPYSPVPMPDWTYHPYPYWPPGPFYQPVFY
jgi:hypothetical protein